MGVGVTATNSGGRGALGAVTACTRDGAGMKLMQHANRSPHDHGIHRHLGHYSSDSHVPPITNDFRPLRHTVGGADGKQTTTSSQHTGMMWHALPVSLQSK